MRVNNPHTYSYSSGEISVDLSKPQKIILPHNDSKTYSDNILTLDYNPKRFDYIKDKHTLRPIKTYILIGKNSNSNTTSYHFMSEDLEKEYGYVNISDNFYNLKLAHLLYLYEDIYNDYPQLGITGPRIIIEYLENLDKSNIGDIGILADKISVAHCIKNNIKPVIVSMADRDSHVAHYIRGKRFIPIEKDSDKYNYYMKKYGTADINSIIKSLIENNSTKDRISTKDWSMLPMYMPQEKIKEIMHSLRDSKELLC